MHAPRIPPLLPALAVLFTSGCASTGGGGDAGEGGYSESAIEAAAKRISEEDLLRDITALSTDEMAGRGPGTPAEEQVIAYLEAELAKAGAQPGNPDGTWVQEVPLVGITTKARLEIVAPGQWLAPAFPSEFIAVTRHTLSEVRVGDSEMVFVGYGVVAPEYGWDDYKDVDVRGKTIVMLVNDPQISDPRDPSKLDDSLFRGKAMTYYGRWTYKYEIASEKGAAAAVIVHQPATAGYPWEVVSGSWGRENFDVLRADGNAGRVPVESWITDTLARTLFKACGQDFDALERSALGRDFRPVSLGARASFALDVSLRDVVSHNVAGRIPGAGPEADEWVVYSAHWDHLGVDPSREGDQIFNGALDNATGTSGLLALARAYSALPRPPRRSILLLAVTAEEKGLLGSKHYAANPLHPLERTLCNVNMDGLNPWGRTSDVVSISRGQTTLEEVLEAEAARQGRMVEPDAEPEKGFFYRSDHFEFAKRGVPALYADAGLSYVGRPEGWGKARRDQYTANDYHKPSDEVRADWDLSGMVEDAQLFFRIGLGVAEAERWPEWLPGTEFKAAREAMLSPPAAP